jgi:hypothetical protein
VEVLWCEQEHKIGEMYVPDLQQRLFAMANINLPVLASRQFYRQRLLFNKFGECPKGCRMYFWYFKKAMEGAESWVQILQDEAMRENTYRMLHPS